MHEESSLHHQIIWTCVQKILERNKATLTQTICHPLFRGANAMQSRLNCWMALATGNTCLLQLLSCWILLHTLSSSHPNASNSEANSIVRPVHACTFSACLEFDRDNMQEHTIPNLIIWRYMKKILPFEPLCLWLFGFSVVSLTSPQLRLPPWSGDGNHMTSRITNKWHIIDTLRHKHKYYIYIYLQVINTLGHPSTAASSSFWVCFLRLDKCLSPTSQQHHATSIKSNTSVDSTFSDRYFWLNYQRSLSGMMSASSCHIILQIVTLKDGNTNWTVCVILSCEAICLGPLPSLNLESAMETSPVKCSSAESRMMPHAKH